MQASATLEADRITLRYSRIVPLLLTGVVFAQDFSIGVKVISAEFDVLYINGFFNFVGSPYPRFSYQTNYEGQFRNCGWLRNGDQLRLTLSAEFRYALWSNQRMSQRVIWALFNPRKTNLRSSLESDGMWGGFG
jgi:hypothetical protein